MYGQRLGWHRAKLEELQGYLEAVTARLEQDDEPDVGGGRKALEAARASLIAGTTYYRKQIEGLEQSFQFSDSSRPTISSA